MMNCLSCIRVGLTLCIFVLVAADPDQGYKPKIGDHDALLNDQSRSQLTLEKANRPTFAIACVVMTTVGVSAVAMVMWGLCRRVRSYRDSNRTPSDAVERQSMLHI